MPDRIVLPQEIIMVLNDRESGSVALLNHLIQALEMELQRSDRDMDSFHMLLITIRPHLQHFAAVDNFLAELIIHMEEKEAAQKDAFPADALQFISVYSDYWQDSDRKITENFLQHCNPENTTILTHSHSETIIRLLSRLHSRRIPFMVLQTLSAPGEEGRKAIERMHQLRIKADLVVDGQIQGALALADHVLMGCDALLGKEFLNKLGTRSILEEARQQKKSTFLLAESRKEIVRPEWKNEIRKLSLFEWVPLELIDTIVTEKYN